MGKKIFTILYSENMFISNCLLYYAGGRSNKYKHHEKESTNNNRPPDKSVQLNFFYFSTKTYVVGTQKNRLDGTVLLSTQNTCLN